MFDRASAGRTGVALGQLSQLLGVPEAAVPGATNNLVRRVRDLKKCLSSGGQPADAETVSVPPGGPEPGLTC